MLIRDLLTFLAEKNARGPSTEDWAGRDVTADAPEMMLMTLKMKSKKHEIKVQWHGVGESLSDVVW